VMSCAGCVARFVSCVVVLFEEEGSRIGGMWLSGIVCLCVWWCVRWLVGWVAVCVLCVVLAVVRLCIRRGGFLRLQALKTSADVIREDGDVV
jgi:hypothetical protein